MDAVNSGLEVGQHISVSMAEISHHQEVDMIEADDDQGATMTDDDDSFGEDEGFSTSDLLQASIQDEITTSLTSAGTIPGLAAAAAVVTSRRHQRPYKFETNPSNRKRQHTRLIRKLKQTMHEFCTRCGQQAVLLCVSPGKDNPSFKVIGASPLDHVVRGCQNVILRELESVLREQAPSTSGRNGENLFELPSLVIDGIPTPVDKMNQAQLRMFIPEMLKYSTGRGKPGWGKESTRPVWWPPDVPWANVRRDVRTDDQKLKVSWSQALRQIVKNCYKYHGRDDLLHCFPSTEQPSLADRLCGASNTHPVRAAQMNLTPPTLVQTVQNSDGSVSLVQLDSGQTIATITQDQSGAAIATLAAQDTSEPPLAMTMHQVNAEHWAFGTTESVAGVSGISSTTADSAVRADSTMQGIDEHDRTHRVVLHAPSSRVEIAKQRTGESKQPSQACPQTIGITFDRNGQAVATLQNTGLTSASEIMLTSTTTNVDDNNSTAMVQIPMSVYEKIASTIQDGSIDGVRRIERDRLGHHEELDLDERGQPSPSIELGSLKVDA